MIHFVFKAAVVLSFAFTPAQALTLTLTGVIAAARRSEHGPGFKKLFGLFVVGLHCAIGMSVLLLNPDAIQLNYQTQVTT